MPRLARRQFLGSAGAVALSVAAPKVLRVSTGRGADRAGASPGAPEHDPLPAEISRLLPLWMETARVPGLAVATVRGGQPAGSRGFGVRDAASGDPVQAGTVFEAASLSKMVTAYVALRLVQRGKLALDTPLVRYAPSPAESDQPLADTITLRHALIHSTGFRNWRFQKEEKLTVDFPPGSKFSYSGEGIVWVERAIEAASGEPFARHVQESIFTPFGMTASSFVWRPEYDVGAARGHDGDGRLSESWVMRLARQADAAGRKGGKPVLDWRYADSERAVVDAGYPALPTFVTPNAAGSLFTTAGDFALFLSRVLEKRARDEASLSDALRAEMRKTQIRAAGAVSWGLGVGLEADRSPPIVWHWGDSGSAQTFALGDPATGDGVVVLTNSSRGLHVCERVVAAVTGVDHTAFLFP